MTLRARITDDLKQAMKNKDQLRLSTLRLINAAIKDRDIALRGDGEDREMSEDEITAVLSRMVKQRQESARAYEEAGRLDEGAAAVEEVIAELEAGSIRDMGPVMNALKSRFTGQMDFGAVGPQVKARLSGAAS